MPNTRSGRSYQPLIMTTPPTPTELQTLIANLQSQVTALQAAAASGATATGATGAGTSTVKFRANPFAADINPATSNGLKLFNAATSERSKSDKLKEEALWLVIQTLN